MFFRRATPHQPTFDERLENLKQFRFQVVKEAPDAHASSVKDALRSWRTWAAGK